MAIQVWIENARNVTLDELLELVPNSKAKQEVDEMREALKAEKKQAQPCRCTWDYVTGESPNYYCGKCGAHMNR